MRAYDHDPDKFRLLCLCEAQGDATLGSGAHPLSASAPLGVHEVEVESKRLLSHDVAEVRLFVRSENFSFEPGQYVVVHVPRPGGAARRSYSICSPPHERRHIELCVRAIPGGYGSNYVHRLKPGRVLRVEGPVGDFTLQDDETELLLVATGSGISPIKSMLLHLLHTKARRRVRLLFGVRHEADLFYTDLIRGLSAHYPSFEAHVVLSRPGEGWTGERGRVTDLIERHFTAADAENTNAYLCGGLDMVVSVKALLEARGVPRARIHHENFY